MTVWDGALEEGELVNIRNEDGRMPLHIATTCGHLAVVRFILENNADISTKDNKSEKPIEHNGSGGHLSVFNVQYSTQYQTSVFQPMRP